MHKWIGFWLLGLIWGSSYLLIHIGVKELSPFQLVFMRTAIAAIGMNIVLVIWRKRLPTSWRELRPLLLIGIGNTTIPLALVSWGEKSVSTGLVSVLQSTEVLFTLLIAHFMFEDERVTLEKGFGLAVGFAGVMILTNDPDQMEGTFFPQLAIVTAALFYAIFLVYSRSIINRGTDPFVMSAGSMTAAAFTSGTGMILAPTLGGQAATPIAEVNSSALLAVLTLGILNTFFAYLISYWVLQQLGATRFSLLTYVILTVGLFLGVVLLDEPFTLRLLLGAFLVLAGIGLSNISSEQQRYYFDRFFRPTNATQEISIVRRTGTHSAV
ncbi:MAG: EamA family transporter [Anaerolineae bacterium]|nr:EamA family transporter [Anaerolineae bacterium]